MSTCEVYAIDQEGDARLHGEARNAWGGAMHIWRVLAEKHEIRDTRGHSVLADFTPLWREIRELPEKDQWVLASTFDNVVVLKEHLPRLIAHLNVFALKHPSSTLQEEIALLSEILTDETLVGACFNQTSVVWNPWLTTAPKGERDEFGDEVASRPYNVYRDNHLKHWQLTPNSFQKERR